MHVYQYEISCQIRVNDRRSQGEYQCQSRANYFLVEEIQKVKQFCQELQETLSSFKISSYGDMLVLITYVIYGCI